jgi:hypothetical protein
MTPRSQATVAEMVADFRGLYAKVARKLNGICLASRHFLSRM